MNRAHDRMIRERNLGGRLEQKAAADQEQQDAELALSLLRGLNRALGPDAPDNLHTILSDQALATQYTLTEIQVDSGPRPTAGRAFENYHGFPATRHVLLGPGRPGLPEGVKVVGEAKTLQALVREHQARLDQIKRARERVAARLPKPIPPGGRVINRGDI